MVTLNSHVFLIVAIICLYLISCSPTQKGITPGKLVHTNFETSFWPWGVWNGDSLVSKQFTFPGYFMIKANAGKFGYSEPDLEGFANKVGTVLSVKHSAKSDSTDYFYVRIEIGNGDTILNFTTTLRTFYAFFVPLSDIERAKESWLGKKLWVNASYYSSYLKPFELITIIDIKKPTNLMSSNFDFVLKHSDSTISNFNCSPFTFQQTLDYEFSFGSWFLEHKPEAEWKSEPYYLDNVFGTSWEADTTTFFSTLKSNHYIFERLESQMESNSWTVLLIKENGMNEIGFKNAILQFNQGKLLSAGLSIPIGKYEEVYQTLFKYYGEPTDRYDRSLKKSQWLFYLLGKSCRSITLKETISQSGEKECSVFYQDLRSILE